MINSTERARLQAAYSAGVDAPAVLRRCAAGLLAVLTISVAGALTSSNDSDLLAVVSAPPAASDR